MPNNYFRFKQFTILQEKSVFKVGTDGVLLGACADLAGAKRILDVGTGTGLIAIMIAQRSNAEIVAIEPEENSYLEACANVSNSKWQKKIMIQNTGFQKYSSRLQDLFDVIISNPPYFRDSLKNPDEYKASARHTGSLTSSEILAGAGNLLNQAGSLQLIMPYAEGTLFIAEASQYGFFCNRIIRVKPNPTGDIKRLILKFERKRKTVSEKFLTIETGNRHHYTEEFKEIMKEYYLNF
jgi:tRNA1Val (adenine37-N6)-methyltransferase